MNKDDKDLKKDIVDNKAEETTEEYSLNDDRRVKILTPGALVAKRFFRNKTAVVGMCILIFMFTFSFIGGLISPYQQDQFFYRTEPQRKDFAAVIENDEFRYATNDNKLFGSAGQAQAMRAIAQNKTEFEYKDNKYTLTLEGEDLYSVAVDGNTVGICFKDVVESTSGKDDKSFEFKYEALKAKTGGMDKFVADGIEYSIDELGNITLGDEDVAFISRFIVRAKMPDVVLTRDFKDKLITTIVEGGTRFEYTDESLIMKDEEGEEGSENAEGTGSEAPMEPEDAEISATAEYDIEYNAEKELWAILQESESYRYDTYSFPSSTHWLGTDKYGMDMLTRLMYGGRISLLIGFIVVIIETTLGVIMGGIAGYFGGWVDNLVMRMVDVFYCLPSTPIIIILGAAMDAQRVDPTMRMVYLMLLLGFMGWAGIARLVRGQILTLREQEYMTAAEATGIKVSSRIFKHLIPNVIPQLIVNCTMALGGIIITEATLSFLGLGVKFPFASWGNIINDVNNTYVLTSFWFIWIPAGVLLLLTVLAFNLVGDGLRDAFDPKMKR